MFERIKRFFCLHEWTADGPITKATCFDYGVPVTCLSQEMRCIKCGARKTERYKMHGHFA